MPLQEGQLIEFSQQKPLQVVKSLGEGGTGDVSRLLALIKIFWQWLFNVSEFEIIVCAILTSKI